MMPLTSFSIPVMKAIISVSSWLGLDPIMRSRQSTQTNVWMSTEVRWMILLTSSNGPVMETTISSLRSKATLLSQSIRENVSMWMVHLSMMVPIWFSIIAMEVTTKDLYLANQSWLIHEVFMINHYDNYIIINFIIVYYMPITSLINYHSHWWYYLKITESHIGLQFEKIKKLIRATICRKQTAFFDLSSALMRV